MNIILQLKIDIFLHFIYRINIDALLNNIQFLIYDILFLSVL